jgi:hypothetical protein
MVQTAKKWKAKVNTEHGRMVKSGVFEKVKLRKFPSDVKVIDTTWAMKKKSNGTLCGRINVHGFKQVEGQHYDVLSISAPVMNGMTIKLVLTLMLASGGIAHVVNIKGAFLHGEFNNGESSISRFHWDLRKFMTMTQFYCCRKPLMNIL